MLKTLPIYADLFKYKLSLAVVLSSVTGYYLFCNTADHRLFFLATGIFLLSSGSAALNQYTERSTDSIMERTMNRPIPSKKIPAITALWISSFLLITGSIFLYINGIIPFFLGLINILLYNLVYTGLKRITVASIIPGALVGAIPPMIGYSSAGGSLLQSEIIFFAIFMFIWQLPHFLLIIIKYGEEYKAAGFATISKYLNEKQIRYLVFFWVLISSCFLFFNLAYALSRNIFIFLFLLNLLFIFFFYRLLFLKNDQGEIRCAFILINSLGVFLMLLIIVTSLLASI
jgi:protoheme IX farnesyltransferase